MRNATVRNRRGRTASFVSLSIMFLGAAGWVRAEGYRAPEVLVAPGPFQGVHGLAVDSGGRLFAGSVVGQSLYQVDPASGAVNVAVGPAQGMADDIAIAPDGTMAWTSFLTGIVHARKGNGPVQVLAQGLPGINSLAYTKSGRLYASQVFLGDALYEIDIQGKKPPRKILEKMGGLNGFEFGPDGWLYGPLWFKGQVVKINVDTAQLKIVADGFATPAAANFDKHGNLYVVDTKSGELVKIDVKTSRKTTVAQLKPALDNLAIDTKRDKIYVSNMADNSIEEVNASTGQSRMIVRSALSAPAGIAMIGDTIYVADTFAFRTVDAKTGKVSEVSRMQASDLEYPNSARASDKTVLLSSWFTGTVQVIDRATLKTREMLHNFKAPHDAVELPDGSLLVAELGSGALVQVSGEHGKNRTPVVSGLQGPAGIALTTDGATAYVTEAAGRLWAVNTRDWSKRQVAEGLKLPEGVAVAPNGRVIVAEVGAKRIVEIDPATGALNVAADNLPIGRPGLPGLPPTNVFTGVATGADGEIYFTSDLNQGLYRIRRL
jgi:sugar lactone lactonase YvrE